MIFAGWTNLKSQAEYYNEAEQNQSRGGSLMMAPQNQNHEAPKLEDFLGYSDSQTETQDSSLTQIYDPSGGGSGYLGDPQDLKALAGFQFQAFSGNSGSEVDDSASVAKTTHAAVGEFVIESSGNDVALSGCATGASLSLGAPHSGERAVAVLDSDASKKVADTFGQRTSIYRGVTRFQ